MYINKKISNYLIENYHYKINEIIVEKLFEKKMLIELQLQLMY